MCAAGSVIAYAVIYCTVSVEETEGNKVLQGKPW